MNEIKCGDEAKDMITGFSGVVVAVTTWLHGCRRITIQPRELKDGKRVESDTFDEMQVEVITPAPRKEPVKTGGDRDDSIALRR